MKVFPRVLLLQYFHILIGLTDFKNVIQILCMYTGEPIVYSLQGICEIRLAVPYCMCDRGWSGKRCNIRSCDDDGEYIPQEFFSFFY